MVKIKIIFSGKKAEIAQLVHSDGNSPAEEFISELKKRKPTEFIKLIALLERFAEFGEIRDITKFRSEIPPLYAFKAQQTRLFCFFLPGASKKTIVLLNGYKKESRKLSTTDSKKALQLYELFIKENKK